MKKKKKSKSNLLIIDAVLVVVLIMVIVLIAKFIPKPGGDKDESSVKAGEGDTNPGVTAMVDNQPTTDVTEAVFADGVTVNGVDLSGKTLEEALSLKESILADAPDKKAAIKFVAEGENVEADAAKLSFTNDLEEVLEKAISGQKAADGSNAFKVTYKASEDSVKTMVEDALSGLNVEPVDALASGFDTDTCKFIIEEEKSGSEVDVEKATADIMAELNNGNYNISEEVEVKTVEPEVTAEFLRGYLCKVSSTTSTTTSDSNRNINIDLICQKINGLVLQPGESFDFNTYIGKRTAEAGFKEAGGIYEGALRQELGGGICQANAMIYHSVVKADLKVDTRTAHTWPSSYVDIGTDATVSWGGPEFKFTNSSDYPIALHAYYGGRQVTVEVYGRPLPDGMKIGFIGVEVSREEAGVEYVADSSLAVGKTVTDRNSHPLIKAKSYKIYYDSNGNEIKREEYLSSNYRMINKKVRVGTLAPDGTVFKLNTKTGEVTAPDGYVPPEPDEPEEIGEDGETAEEIGEAPETEEEAGDDYYEDDLAELENEIIEDQPE